MMKKKQTEFFAEFNIIPASVIKVDSIGSKTCRNSDNRNCNVGLVVHDGCLVQRQPSSGHWIFSHAYVMLKMNEYPSVPYGVVELILKYEGQSSIFVVCIR